MPDAEPQCPIIGHYEESPGHGWREQCILPEGHGPDHYGKSGRMRPPWLETDG